MKLCSKCQEIKPFAEFGVHRSQKSGLRSWCKVCSRLYKKKYPRRTVSHSGSTEYYRKNKEAILSALSAKRQRNPEEVRRFEHEQYLKHKDSRKAREARRQEAAPEKTAAKSAIGHLIERGGLLPASEYLCISCGKQASDHHHPSYHKDSRLNVVPLCRSCHVKIHNRDDFAMNGGIIALPIGIVRIAIATE